MIPSLPDSLLDEVHDLIYSSLSGEASPADVERLNELLSGNETARRIYANAIRDTYTMRRWAAAEELRAGDAFGADDLDAESLPAEMFAADPLAAAPEAAPPTSGILHGAVGFFSQVGPLSYVVATLIMTALLLKK